ncbi:hypothetical protein H696_04288 [Fonticula alba]|uniref:Uncharacterized protein n=1 Tax=Fonticula alba TaxID=691883 RepID=A0A058Z3K0_FONAL|nr:hypothetical protein H696_04288 [Fonticula alba]KCV68869.1 hypothetical protein H696_04288 [Fonticula alba]|eukprot:XP_009496440.1 hypothetical protein H696_04288 [Fonticula alba]
MSGHVEMAKTPVGPASYFTFLMAAAVTMGFPLLNLLLTRGQLSNLPLLILAAVAAGALLIKPYSSEANSRHSKIVRALRPKSTVSYNQLSEMAVSPAVAYAIGSVNLIYIIVYIFVHALTPLPGLLHGITSIIAPAAAVFLLTKN